MKNLSEKKKGSAEETRRVLKFMTLPLIAIVLMIVIVVLDKPEDSSEKASETLAEVTSAAKEPDNTQEESQTAETKEPVITLEEEAVPEIHDLMEAYFKARRTCDVEAFSEIYGGTCGQDILHAQRVKMEEEVKFYQSFNNLVCYTTPGLFEGDYVVYAKYDIKFRQADTLAPSMIVVYASTAGDGSIYLTAQTSEEQLAYLTKVNQSEQAQNLAAEVNRNLSEALKADENLLAVYRTLVVDTDESREEGETQDSSSAASESQDNETKPSEGGQEQQEETSEQEE